MNKLISRWPAIAAAFVFAQALVALAVKPGPVRTIYSTLSYFLILLLATAAAALNAYRSTRESRLFWSFITAGCALWSLVGWDWIYWDVLHRGSLDTRRLAQPLFLHIVPLMAAAVAWPHLKQSGSNLYRTTLNFLLLLFFWVFLYAYFVLPFVAVDLAVFNQRFAVVYILENIALLVALAVVVSRTQSPWRGVYWHFLGASLLYTVASMVLNLTYIYSTYNTGGWLDVPVTAAYCWFAWIPLYGMKLGPQLQPTVQPDTSDHKYLSPAAMLVVIAIPLIGVWELFRNEASPEVHRVRLLAVLVSFVLMAVALFGKEYLANRELVEEIALNLRFSEERFYKAFDSNPEGITISAVTDGRYIEVNDAFLRMMGYRRSELLGKTPLELNVWCDPEDRSRMIEELTQKGCVRSTQVTFRTKSGHVLDVEISAENIQLEGEPCLLAITRDVTRHKLLEQQLRQAQKMEAVGRLAGGVAHDFNNLLGVILGYTEMLGKDLAFYPDWAKRVETIKSACLRAASLTAQLLAFSRQQKLNPRVLDLNSTVSETGKMLQRLLGEEIEQRMILDPTLGPVKADPGQIVQVIMNLALNAGDAMPNGGELTIKTANATFEEDTLYQGASVRPGRYVMLAVSDTGIGMDAETQAQIFEPFYTTKPAGEGTGFGLATVSGIIEQSEGYIFVQSELGKGTTFKIYLPRVDEAIEPTVSPVATATSQGAETILLVEDDFVLRGLIHEGLSSRGYKLLVAANGVDALQVSEQHAGSIDVLITDVIMPQMGGPELARMLVPRRPGIKVLYISGYTADKLRNIPLSDPDVALIEKPFQLVDLARKLREILDRSAQTVRPLNADE